MDKICLAFFDLTGELVFIVFNVGLTFFDWEGKRRGSRGRVGGLLRLYRGAAAVVVAYDTKNYAFGSGKTFLPMPRCQQYASGGLADNPFDPLTVTVHI